MAQQFIVQPPFDKRIQHRAFPLGGGFGGQYLQTGYMVWDKPLPGYSSRAVIRYLYNPSTVAADYSIADASAQASLNFPNPGDSAMLAIPLSQTAQWTLMFDRTFEVWQSYQSNGLPANGVNVGGNGSLDAGTLGVQADVLAFMQFTGMLTNYSSGTQNVSGAITKNAGIMQLVPSWALFANNNVVNGLQYFGYINEWSVQYTHWTQFNVPMRCVISVNWTMLPNPNNGPPSVPGIQVPGTGVQPTPGGGQVNNPFPGVTGPVSGFPLGSVVTGIGGR